MKNDTRSWAWALAGLALHAAAGGTAAAQALAVTAEPAPETLAQELARGFYSRINVLAYGVIQDPKDSPLNPDNVLDLPRYQAVINPRADFNLEFRRWEFSLKPRAELVWERWEDGRRDGDAGTRSDFFINEGFVRYRPVDELLLSYGRENLQWGPSVILSSSNPFNRDNGRNNPKVEVPGLDFVRAIWIPSLTWTLSAIANIDDGRLDQDDSLAVLQASLPDASGAALQSDDFERTYALKLDYTGQDGYFSLIPSYREHDRYSLGFFGGWNVSDALLLYGEGSAGEDDELLLQAGAAYTLEAGPTINLEYLRNNEGCVDKSMTVCLASGELDTRNVLFRRDYVMLQYTDTELVQDLSFNLRLIHNLNDDSNRLIGIFEYEVGDHVQLYLIANGFTGDTDTEFGSLLRYSVFLGMGYTF